MDIFMLWFLGGPPRRSLSKRGEHFYLINPARAFLPTQAYAQKRSPQFRITPWVSEVRAPLETLAFLGRTNLVETDSEQCERSP